MAIFSEHNKFNVEIFVSMALHLPEINRAHDDGIFCFHQIINDFSFFLKIILLKKTSFFFCLKIIVQIKYRFLFRVGIVSSNWWTEQIRFALADSMLYVNE